MINNLFYPDNFPKAKEGFLKELFLHLVDENPKSYSELDKIIKNYLGKKKEKDFYPSFWMLNFIYHRYFSNKFLQPEFLKLTQKHKTRSISGIVPLSIFTKPQNSCPFNCVYCAKQKGVPKSYFPDEAAIIRAHRNKYDPFLQTRDRLIQFFLNNHPIDKVDAIIQGGTFSCYDKNYREEFVKQMYDACDSDIASLIKGEKELIIKSKNLEEAKKINEVSNSRVVGLAIETRPDFINEEEIIFLRKLGVTRVELGVQSLDNEVLKLIRRGHDVDCVIKATKMLKEAGFKVTYHLMPGLPGSNLEKDLKTLKRVFEDDNFKPDSIKFYPTQVVWGSEIYDWYKKGLYKPMTEKELITLVYKFKKEIVPHWVRIQRLVRDLTKNDVAVDTFPSNFRQTTVLLLKQNNIICPCIRCREIRDKKPIGKVSLRITRYNASKGIEYFIEGVDEGNNLLGFIRLRIPEYFLEKKKFFIKELENGVLIRELHVYGPQISLGARGRIQHTGLGEKLLGKAEEIAMDYKATKIAVISGVGVRQYYEKFGYHLNLESEFMIKNLITEKTTG